MGQIPEDTDISQEDLKLVEEMAIWSQVMGGMSETMARGSI